MIISDFYVKPTDKTSASASGPQAILGATSEQCLQVSQACDVVHQLPLTVTSPAQQFNPQSSQLVRPLFKLLLSWIHKSSASQIESEPSANWGSQRRLARNSQLEYAKQCAKIDRLTE